MRKQPKPVEQCLTPDEMAGLLKVSTFTVIRAINRGRDGGLWPVYKVGKQWRIPQSTARSFLESHANG